MMDFLMNRFVTSKQGAKEILFILLLVTAAFVLQTDNIYLDMSRRSRVLRKGKTYSSNDVFWTQGNFTQKNYQLIFDGNDSFITYGERTDPNRVRVYGVNHRIVEALLNHFPDRFAPGQPPFQLLFSVSDSPITTCIAAHRCAVDHFAPVLQFGSVPRDPTILPTIIAMPLPTSCMRRKCDFDLLDPNYEGISWDDLKPQVVWRGTDFGFLQYFGREWKQVTNSHISIRNAKTPQDAIDALRIAWDKLTPRWRAVLLSLMANQEVGTDGNLPWIDAKFFDITGQYKHFRPFKEIGASVSTSEFMGLSDLATYKYHVDIGGGGGTTWEGTLDKLGMPGLLFHHETATKDYFYDELVAWKHYVPVDEDLSDLREKYEWAEAHPEEAKEISKAATEFVTKFKLDANKGELYEKYMLEPLEKVVNAYQPGDGETFETIKEQFKVGGPLPLIPLGECSRELCNWPNVLATLEIEQLPLNNSSTF